MESTTEKALGEAIRARRNALKMTLEKLGTEAGVDVSQLSKIERGICRTSFPTYDRIAKALSWTPAAMWRHATRRTAA